MKTRLYAAPAVKGLTYLWSCANSSQLLNGDLKIEIHLRTIKRPKFFVTQSSRFRSLHEQQIIYIDIIVVSLQTLHIDTMLV